MALPWKLHGDGKTVGQDAIVLPEERLSWGRTIGFGTQHVVAMFGATFLVPLITGFPPTATLFFSGLGTMLFLLMTGNRLPSYLGSSFAFLAPIAVATAGFDYGDVAGLARASFAIIAMGVLVALVGIAVQRFGTGWVNALMPPVVMGAVVALIGFNLAPAVKNNWFGNPASNPDVNQGLHSTAALITIASDYSHHGAVPGPHWAAVDRARHGRRVHRGLVHGHRRFRVGAERGVDRLPRVPPPS